MRFFKKLQSPIKSSVGLDTVSENESNEKSTADCSSDTLDVSTVTRKWNSPNLTRKSMSSSASIMSFGSRKERTVIEFTIDIEAIDGIISTNTGRNTGQHGVPVFGVLSYDQKVQGKSGVVKTNIPSMPLVKSNSSFGNRDRYQAGFGIPSDIEPNHASKQVKFRLPMIKNKHARSGYEKRQIDFVVNLMRASEFIRMGTVTLVLSGDEMGGSKLLHIGQGKTVRTTRVKENKFVSTKTKSTVGAKSATFMGDPTRRYSLQRSTLRVSVTAEEMSGGSHSVPRHAPVSQIVSLGTSETVSVMTGMVTDYSGRSRNSRGRVDSRSRDTLLHESSSSSSSGSSDDDMFQDDDCEGSCDEDSKFSHRESLGFVPYEPSDSSSSSSLGSQSSESDNSTLLDNVSLGSIRFKEIGNIKVMDSKDGFEVSSKQSTWKKPTNNRAKLYPRVR